MSAPRSEPSTRWWRTSLVPWLVMPLSLLVTGGVWHLSNQYLEEIAKERFFFSVASVVDAVHGRMRDYEQVLRGGVGLFAAAKAVSKQQWHEYVTNADMPEHYPGIQNMAVDFPIAAAEKSAHIAAMRAQGYTDYTIRPEQPERPIYHTLAYVEPFGGRNLRAFGFDMYTNPTRRAAMDRAIDEGLPTISGMVRLAQETNQDVQNGFIFCLPVYHPGRPASTPEQRRAALRALVCGGFRVNDLMRGIFGSSGRDVELEIFDDGRESPETLLYTSMAKGSVASSSRSTSVPIEVGGRKWLLRVTANQRFVDSSSSLQSNAIAIAGTVFNLALLIALISLIGRETRARELATAMTEQVRNDEKRLAEINLRFELAADSAMMGVWDYDIANDVLLWDARMYKLFQVQAEDFHPSSRTWMERLHPEDRQRMQDELSAAITGGSNFDTTFRIVVDGGAVRSIRANALVTKDANGIAVRMTGINSDISELVEAGAALQDRNAQLDALFRLSPDGFVAFGADDTVRFVNPAFVAMTGLTALEVVGTDQNRFDGLLRTKVDNTDRFDGVAAYFGSDGQPPRVRQLSLAQPRQTVLQIIGIRSQAPSLPKILYLRDITRESEVERLKSEFLSHAAHELRTPMASIYGFSELLLEMDLDEATRKDLLETIHRQTRWLVEIINELLDLSRIEAGGSKDIKFAATDLVALVRATAADLSIDPERWPLTLDLPEVARTLTTDAAKLRQVLVNVIGNARKYSPEGGAIRIALVEASDEVGIAVTDSGIGMSEDQLTHLGERFWRADTSGKTPGTGLGFAIVQETLTLLGGRVEVSSRPSHGTRVTLWLPAT